MCAFSPKALLILVVTTVVTLTWPTSPPHPLLAADRIRLVQATMCEGIVGYEPVRPAVVFSLTRGRVSCFSQFDRISEATHIHHKWYRRDSLITVKRLTLKPPRWSSFTSVQLRDADKGPWRIEITDAQDRPLHTLRFSITD